MPNFGTLTKRRNPASANFGGKAAFDRAATVAPAVKAPVASLPYAAESGGFSFPMAMATILIFMQLGRPFDQFLFGYHVPAFVGSIGIVVMFFTKWLDALRTRVGIPLVLFLMVMCAAALFSIWRGGSFSYVQQYVELNLVLFCLVAAAPSTVGQLRFLAIVALFSCLFNVAAGTGFDAHGRLYLTDLTYGNSDDVALLGGFCIPLVLLFASRLGKIFGTIVGVSGVVGCLALVGLSAARFALISLTVMAVHYFLRGRGGQRVAVIVCFACLAMGSIFFLPKSTLARLSTITSALNSDAAVGGDSSAEAIDSMRERQQLSIDALQAFMTHPLLGVGPNVFVDWRFDTLHRRGQPAHDTYLQAAAEEGFFGVAFYSAFLIGAFVTATKCVKPLPGWEEGRDVALAVERSLVYFIVSAFFITCVSHAHQFVLAALLVGLERVKNNFQADPQIAGVSEPAENLMLPRQPQMKTGLPPTSRPDRTGAKNPVSSAPRPQRYRFNRPIHPSHTD